ncbi:MAG TPA: carboxypeptidase regulatory-like domain-containing protein, partial [Pelobium sp.]
MDKKLQKRLALSLVMLFFTVFSTLAQVTTSSMSGVVKDGKGDASIGATVKAVHVPSGTVYSSQTNVDGRFFIANMRTGGPYTLEVSYIGYQPQKFTGINLLLGETYKITATLSSSDKLLNEVVVTAQGSKLNNNKTGASTNVSTEQLTVLPTISRSVTDFTRLTPQANGNGFAGRDGRYNNLQIDG